MVADGVLPLLFKAERMMCLSVPFSSTICWIICPGGTCRKEWRKAMSKCTHMLSWRRTMTATQAFTAHKLRCRLRNGVVNSGALVVLV